MSNEAVIIDAVRTPYGKRAGQLREWRPDSLLASTIAALVARSGVSPGKVEDVIAGCVSQAGEQAANVGRLAALMSGLPPAVSGVALNRMCGSSQQATHFAAQAVAAGDMDYVIAGGVESMTRVPMFLDVTLGQSEFKGFESLNPKLLELYPLVHQIESAERIGTQWEISRQQCDAWSVESHRRASRAGADAPQPSILEVAGVDADGGAITVHRDEGVRAVVDAARMAALKPIMRPMGEGVVTAANASQISDGASAVLIADRAVALADGLRPKARFLARVACGSDPVLQLTGVIPATHKALARAGLSIADLDWVEINEAFASVVLAWAREFTPDMDKVNPWGGAIAHGHPLGASGGGLLAKMLDGLAATGGTLGLQLMCIGHGMATATIVERV
ncbi:MAG: acetyl-CoA acetyltransferase [Hydrocarboniphaga sp.]|uniref:thiolase family protein n=1 Tax=Hydrocarboniphaga sp. TaxID=2033016 RepID=UPI002621FB85|nr:thiolase family protein [Hydrocarboniphaga sp.]MDB5971434.1 acetyl-CoA acetyltransferase [Hydrocarboniphaga sp.]